MIYTSVSILIMVLVPIVGGIIYAIKKDDMYEPEESTVFIVIAGMILAWAWPLLILLALVASIAVAMVFGTAKLTEKVMNKRSKRKSKWRH